MLSAIKPFEKLEFTDDFMFYQVMQHDDICKDILEHLLKVRIDHIERQEVQKELKPYYENRGVRLDAYIKDSNRIFNIAMQKVSSEELPKRSRYYCSMLDASDLLLGVDYTKLSETFIIFLCTKDPFGKGLPVYSFKTTCQEDKDFILNDETYKLFFNAANAENENDLEIRAFLNYIKCSESSDLLTDKIDAIVQEIKHREENKEAYMIEHLKVRDSIMEGLREGRIEGQKEGRQQMALEAARNLLKMNLLTREQIAQAVGLPLEQVLEIQHSMSVE